MATVLELRIIGNLGRNAITKKMERGLIAINFPVAHNKNWRDKKTGEIKTKTIWVNCTIWKKDGANMGILDYLKSGNLVELIGTPYAKAYTQEDGSPKAEIRLNVSQTNILRANKNIGLNTPVIEEDCNDNFYDDSDGFYTINQDD